MTPTFEKTLAEIKAEGWHIAHLQELLNGVWHARLWCAYARKPGDRGLTGFDRRDAWSDLGTGPDAVTAIRAAAKSVMKMEEALDLNYMLS